MTLLVEAPAGRHVAQFHRDADTLLESAFVFLEAGLRRGNSLLLIASADQVERVNERFAASKYHPTALRNSGQLVVLDATTLIEQSAGPSSGEPEWAGFRETITPILANLRPYGRGIRIYTEMSNALWAAGNTDAAIWLEEFWNALARTHQFSLYCGYHMDTLSEESYAAPLEELGRTHSDILGTPEDDRFGIALDRASKEIFGISLTQMAGVSRQDGARRFPSGQRTMLWVKRNLPMSTAQLAERARHYFRDGHA